MSIKKTLKNKFIWIVLSIVALLGLAVLIIPPTINLNFLKPKIENVILTRTGVPAVIHGDINFSLTGSARIVAHDVSIPNGTVESCEFSIPFFDIFNIKEAKISGEIFVNGASIFVEKIVPFTINNKIVVNNSKMKFLNKEYTIIDATLAKNGVDAIVRTDQHKYEIKSHDNLFTVKNKNNDLILSGELFTDGTAKAHIEITAQNINKWFEFEKPRIKGQFPVAADLSWDGQYGIKFSNISARGISGNVDMKNDGFKIIKLKSENADYDLSLFLQNPSVLQNAIFDLDFYGNLTFANKNFHHIKMKTIGSNDEVKIDTIILDDIKIQGGTIDKDGAHNVNIAGPLSGLHTTCLFNGTPTNWWCEKYSHGNNITSVFSVKDDVIDADVYSTAIYEDMKPFVVTIRKLASSGEVRFYYPDMTGTLHLRKDGYTVDYTRLDDKSLNQAKINLKFLPDFMKDEPGDFVWLNGVMIFTPNSKQWQLSKSTNFFILRGENFKRLTQKIDLQAFNDLPYVLSGNYKNGNISDFSVEIAGHKLTGMLAGKSITLKTDVLNADLFVNQSFWGKFEELSFFSKHPILLPFEANINIALSANKLIYKDTEYNNFIYSLNKNTQTFSISDSTRGNLLARIDKHNIKYDINIQLNKFMFNNKILPEYMPLNISDTYITAEIKLNTYGKIAHDIVNNLKGTFDASFTDGKLYGIGLDAFYANADNITILNQEQLLSEALRSGTTTLKKMHIIGTYENGNVQTTKPLTLSMKHVDASGILEITNNEMFAQLQLVLRGTSAGPEPIDLTIYPNDQREMNFSQIMLHFDAEYMKSFVKSHNQF